MVLIAEKNSGCDCVEMVTSETVSGIVRFVEQGKIRYDQLVRLFRLAWSRGYAAMRRSIQSNCFRLAFMSKKKSTHSNASITKRQLSIPLLNALCIVCVSGLSSYTYILKRPPAKRTPN